MSDYRVNLVLEDITDDAGNQYTAIGLSHGPLGIIKDFRLEPVDPVRFSAPWARGPYPRTTEMRLLLTEILWPPPGPKTIPDNIVLGEE